MNSIESFYLAQDVGQVMLSEEISAIGRDALQAHFSGDLPKAQACYEYWSPDLESSVEVANLLAADKCLVHVKIGKNYEKASFGAEKTSTFCRYIENYARYSSFFWRDHKVAWRALWRMFFLSLFLKPKGSTLMPIFLVGHMWAIKSFNFVGLFIAQYAFRAVRKNKSHQNKFFSNIVYAAFPYTLLVSAKINRVLPTMIEVANDVSVDAYYQGVFRASCLYAFAYSRDVVRTEMFASQLNKIHSDPRVLRYRSLAKVIVFMPMALRGYGYLVEDDFRDVLARHVDSENDNLINSQFYRSAAVTALCLNDKKLSAILLSKAETFRASLKSFQAWGGIDSRIKYFIELPRNFDPSRDVIIEGNEEVAETYDLARFMIALNSALPEVSFGKKSLIDVTVQLLQQHLNITRIDILTAAPDFLTRSPMLIVQDRYLVVRDIEDERIGFLFNIFSWIAPIVKNLETTIRRIESMKIAHEENFELAAIGKAMQLVAHDIRRPLSVLETGLSLIKERSKGGNLDSIVADLELDLTESSRSVHQLLEDIMQLGAKRKPKTQLVATDDLIQKAIKLTSARQMTGWNNLELLGERGTRIIANPSQIVRVLANLIENAVQATTGKVTITTEKLDALDKLKISVFNEGSFISEEIQRKIFSPFFTLKQNGTGLGLAAVKKILDDHLAQISVQSYKERGTTFSFELSLEGTSPRSDLGQKEIIKVAFVEDSAIFRRAYKQFFSSNSHIHLQLFESPESFTDSDCTEIDILVTDYYFDNSPTNGLDFAKALRKQGVTQPIYLATDSDDILTEAAINAVIGKEPKNLVPYLS